MKFILTFLPLLVFSFPRVEIPSERNLLYDTNGDKIFENLNYLLKTEEEIPVIVLLK